jgi:prepilin-type N-terminal cleavage/methylation domain-containing protein
MMKQLRHVLRRDRGVSLIEMLVVVSILGTIFGIVTQGLVTAQQTLNRNSSRLDGLSQTNVAMEALTRVLRTAILPSQVQATCSGCDVAAFIEGDDFMVRFYANVDNDGILPATGTTDAGPRRVTYDVNAANELIETIQKPNVHSVTDFNYQYCTPGPGCPVRTRVLARDLVVDPSTPLFTYYDRSGLVIDTPLQSDVSRLKAVDSIDLVASVKPNPVVDSATVTARVTLPNADSLIQPTPTATP